MTKIAKTLGGILLAASVATPTTVSAASTFWEAIQEIRAHKQSQAYTNAIDNLPEIKAKVEGLFLELEGFATLAKHLEKNNLDMSALMSNDQGIKEKGDKYMDFNRLGISLRPGDNNLRLVFTNKWGKKRSTNIEMVGDGRSYESSTGLNFVLEGKVKNVSDRDLEILGYLINPINRLLPEEHKAKGVRIYSNSKSTNAYAASSGGYIGMTTPFLNLSPDTLEHALTHEMGHTYYSYILKGRKSVQKNLERLHKKVRTNAFINTIFKESAYPLSMSRDGHPKDSDHELFASATTVAKHYPSELLDRVKRLKNLKERTLARNILRTVVSTYMNNPRYKEGFFDTKLTDYLGLQKKVEVPLSK